MYAKPFGRDGKVYGCRAFAVAGGQAAGGVTGESETGETATSSTSTTSTTTSTVERPPEEPTGCSGPSILISGFDMKALSDVHTSSDGEVVWSDTAIRIVGTLENGVLEATNVGQ
jgi:hypothetical protein